MDHVQDIRLQTDGIEKLATLPRNDPPGGRLNGCTVRTARNTQELKNKSAVRSLEEAASDGVGSTAERLTSHPTKEDDMATSDHKGAPSALEQSICAQRTTLVSAHAVQRCLYEVLLYAEGEDAVMYAETAHVVATLMEDVIDKLDSVQLRGVLEGPEPSGTTDLTL